MISKAILLFLGTALLLKGYNAAPNPETESAAQVELLKLQKLYSTEINDLNILFLKEGVTIFEKVLKDPKVLEITSDLMKIKLEEIRNFITAVEDFEKKDKKEGSEFSVLDAKFDSLAKRSGKNTLEEDVIKRSLKDNGLLVFPSAAEAHVKAFTDKFLEELEKYVNGLNEVEKKDDILRIFVVLLDELRTESDPKARFEIISRIAEN